jgi:hypothetical protein
MDLALGVLGAAMFAEPAIAEVKEVVGLIHCRVSGIRCQVPGVR